MRATSVYMHDSRRRESARNRFVVDPLFEMKGACVGGWMDVEARDISVATLDTTKPIECPRIGLMMIK